MADSQTPTNTEGTLDSSEVAAAVVSSPKPTGLTAPANTPRGSVSEPEPALLKALQKQSVSNASEVQARLDALALNEEDGEQEEVDAEGEDEEDEGVCVKALRDLQTKRHELQMAYEAERLALEQKFNKQYYDLYDERATIIAGKSTTLTSEDPEEVAAGIDNFWLHVFAQHGMFSQVLSERDAECMRYLQDIKCVDNEDMKGYTLEFTFSATNPYFRNTVLSKSYVIPNMMDVGEPMLQKAVGTEILWKEGQNLTVELVTKKQKKKGKRGSVRTVTREEPCESFFNFFAPPEMEEDEADEDEDPEEAEERMQTKMDMLELDFELGMILRNQIIPNAVLWYTGEAAEDEDDSDSDYVPGSEEEDDDEDDSEDVVDSDGDAPPAFPSMDSLGKPAADGGAPGAGGENPGECKQQ